MTPGDLRTKVRAYFDQLDHDLESVTRAGRVIPDKSDDGLSPRDCSDLLELYVFSLVAVAADKAVVENPIDGRYVVSLSPSEDWQAASRLRLSLGDATVAARTGISIQSEYPGDPGTTEMDVVVADVDAADVLRRKLPGHLVLAGAECKSYTGKLGNGDAQNLTNKAQRVWAHHGGNSTKPGWWTRVPATEVSPYRLATIDRTTDRCALVTLSTDATRNAAGLLRAAGIAVLTADSATDWVDGLMTALRAELATPEEEPISLLDLLLASADDT